MDIKVRDLNVDDVFTVAEMLGKITKSARAELIRAIEKKKINPMEIGMVFAQSLCVEAKEDMKAWMAELVEKPVKEFGKMPPRTLIEIVKQLAEKDDIKDFLAQVSLRVKEWEETESTKPST